MRSTNLLLGSLLTSVTFAQPHQRHHHAARHENHHQKQQRDQAVVWVTDWEYVTETIPVTTTIWVTPGFVPPSPSTSVVASTSDSGGLFFETSSPQAPTPQIVPSSSSAYVAPSSEAVQASSVPEETPAPVATPAYVAPVQPSSPPAEVTTTPAPAPTPANTPTTVVAAPPAPATSPASYTPSNGECSSDSPCSGDITYYTAGLGSCGWTDDGDSETVVALSHELMGAQSNGNPYCGQYITVQAGGKTVTAKVVDKCMGCSKYSIDLSTSAFSALVDFSVGRTQATWWFN